MKTARGEGGLSAKTVSSLPCWFARTWVLLLRALVAFMLVTQATAASGGWIVKVPVLIGATLLLLGLMTPIVAVAIGLGITLAFSDNDVVQVEGLNGAIALLGPRAFSIDARLFGRREIFIPRRATEAPAAPDHSRP